MENPLRIIAVGILCLSLLSGSSAGSEPNDAGTDSPSVKAAVIVCKGMIDDGLFKSIQRRTQTALDADVEYLIYEIQTYGGLVQSADDISKYFILDIGKRAHTVAYVTTEAISAGAMISVSCQDIIMLENTTIGDCAPIMLGGKLEGVEREKTESFIRAVFTRASEANGYPAAMLKAMVTMQIKVYRINNLQTGEYEFFEDERLPDDPNVYDIEKKELIVKDDELLIIRQEAKTGIIKPLKPIITKQKIFSAQKTINEIYVDEKVEEYILNLVFATRDPKKYGLDDLANLIEYGASPRASINLVLASKARAFLEHRGYITPEDVRYIGTDILRHRIILTYEAEAEEITSDDIVQRLFDTIEVP